MVVIATPSQPEAVFSWMESLGEPTRLRLLRLLERNELGVAPLCEVLQLPQSTVSRHLKVLADEGFVRSRPQGTNRLYRMERMEKDAPARRLWLVVRDQTEGWATAAQDALRLEQVLARQRPAAEAFFAGAARDWDRLREEAYGRSLSRTALLSLLPSSWVVADLGCGTGSLSVLLAPYVARVIAVDQSADMLRAARGRTAAVSNVDLRRGRLESLPIDDTSCDAALLVLALSYVPEPRPVLHEMVRVLRPGGRAVVVDLLRHDREDFRDAMGHQSLGFEAEDLEEAMGECGLGTVSVRPMLPEPGATGPALLLATAARSSEERPRPTTDDSNQGERTR